MQIKQILVPTDFSENAQHALSYATELAKRCSAKLHLLHTPVIPTYLLMDLSYSPGPEAVTRILNESQDALDEQAKSLESLGVEYFTVIREGTVHEVIRDYAKEHDVDLVVVGTHGRSGVAKLMYGSVTERVIKTVHTPIIVIPPDGGKMPSSIVVAYDFSAPSKRAAEVARAIHGFFPGPLHLVHSYLDVWGEYTDRGAVVGEAAEKRRQALHLGLEEMLQTESKELLSSDGTGIETHLVTGDPAEGLLRVAQDVGATLICAGTTGKSGIERLLIGSVARRLLHDSKVPLLLTHNDA
ncbi:MAG: universal stress protein [Deltaproteobacteria bacterium]|nr:universal stress protein [Deltaproteobacteria bacterium]NND30008.1 universal stress protein [Myxococcales bacterium]MBT8466408.1 universal stress protein [Deltaproteobacteria bacterium]MBT8480860.1 universal stress protein [Deltaproteobacteria bacterium]NNK08363.1 universal stress protein [Myxococcales bacterium]